MAFEGLLHWSLKHNFMSYWELDALDWSETHGEDYDFKEDHKKKLERAFDVCYFLDCPICNDLEALGCELDSDQLDAGIVRIVRTICVGCGLKISEKIPFLADIVCERELDENRVKILEEFGIEPKA
jgi:hypothetical protein